MIKLLQSLPAYGLPNPSPFCLKTEIYLKLANLDYQGPLRLLPAPWHFPNPSPKLDAIKFHCNLLDYYKNMFIDITRTW